MASVTMKVLGDKELQALMAQIPAELERETLVKATAAGAKIVLAAAKQGVPIRTGRLRQALALKSLRRGRRASALVGARWPKGAHAHLVEKGTAAHLINQPKMKRLLLHPGARPQPFLGPAFQSRRAEVLAVMRFEVWKKIQSLARG